MPGLGQTKNEERIEARQTAKVAATAPPDGVVSVGATKVNPKDGLTYVWIPPGTFVNEALRLVIQLTEIRK